MTSNAAGSGDTRIAALPTTGETVPRSDDGRRAWFRNLMRDATIVGVPLVWQQAAMRRETSAAGFDTFLHERDLAGPEFRGFRVPNVDTLYSSAWIDLRRGPVEIDLPDFSGRYFTIQLLDARAEVSNLSRRTIGGARRLRLLGPGQEPAGTDDRVEVTVTSPVMWALMRIQARGDDLETVHALQDAVTIRAASDLTATAPHPVDVDVETDPTAFLVALDECLRMQGHPVEETALFARFRHLGVLAETPPTERDLDAPASEGLREGFEEALAILSANRAALGTTVPTGWTRVSDKGRHGYNYLNRAIMNFVGLGANVVEENTSFNTYADADGDPLSGDAQYGIDLADPPPNDAFWSITAYDAETGYLLDVPDRRHAVGSGSGGRTAFTGGIVSVGPDPESETWLPTTPGRRFFLVLRIYSPHEHVVAGRWTPPTVQRST